SGAMANGCTTTRGRSGSKTDSLGRSFRIRSMRGPARRPALGWSASTATRARSIPTRGGRTNSGKRGLMAEPLRVVSWLWKPRARPPYFEPPTPAKYGPEHVHTLRNMLARHLHMDYEFCCITDDQTGLDPDIRVIPLWDKGMEYGG